ncbi:MAG TPA: 3-phosphoserine/phosphohydroxythreonine transaminase [Anaerolineaceae bacterium]|nr:3-phosphoserine/phosphohydroxythreonine transaminase [Anaerolineaceae bacterium]
MNSSSAGKLYRAHNFNPGPAVLPLSVLQQAQAELLDYQGSGMSVMEISHRSKAFENIIQTAEADLRELLGIPANYKVMFLQGGASLQFAMVPMNLRPAGVSADYVVTGSWSKTALKESSKVGMARVAATAESTNFSRLPDPSELQCDPNAAFFHFTSNETIHGVEWKTEPEPPTNVALVCDMSSDFVSRPVNVSKYGLIYAGAQKNAGPAGVTLVIIRDDLLARGPANLPVMLDYKTLAESGSLHNTPPCYSIYIVGLVMKWLKGLGGVSAMAKINQEKAGLVYKAIDSSGGFYRGHAAPEARSNMNIPFRLPNEDLENLFVKESEKQGLVGLKGHRSVGGLRASLYNALPTESVQALVQFMAEFQRTKG